MTNAAEKQFSILFKSSDLLTRKEAAEYLRISSSTLAVWASTKRYNLPYVKVGRTAKYRFTDLEEFLRQRTVTHQSI